MDSIFIIKTIQHLLVFHLAKYMVVHILGILILPHQVALGSTLLRSISQIHCHLEILVQPAMQPFVPGQTIVLTPEQQDSGRGFGQMIKETLVFSTINAGVNRLINPHTHYVKSKPDSRPTTTHVTYNNQYFNTPPGVNNTTNPTNLSQGSVPNGNYPTGVYTPNVGANNMASPGNGNMYPTNTLSNGESSPSRGVETVTGMGTTGNVVFQAIYLTILMLSVVQFCIGFLMTNFIE